MFAEEMLVAKNLREAGGIGFNRYCEESHVSEFFYDLSSVGSGADCGAPTERCVAVDENGGGVQGIEVVKTFDDDLAGVPFVFGLDFGRGHGGGDRD